MRLGALLTACDTPGEFPLPPGRAGFEFVARLCELEKYANVHPNFDPDPYSRGTDTVESIGQIPADMRFSHPDKFSPAEPFRSLIANKLKLSGSGAWPSRGVS